MKIYLAGKITGLEGYKTIFEKAKTELIKEGYLVMNPAVLPYGFEHSDYLKICYSMIDVCDCVYFLSNWEDSEGARLERDYAIKNNKITKYQERL